MSIILNSRSPYFINFTSATQEIEFVSITIKIWDGNRNSPPSVVDYQITKTPPETGTGNNVYFEFSELVRDYLETDFYEEAVDAVWVRVDYGITYTSSSTPVTGFEIYLALDGYGNFDEGANPRTSIDPTDDSYTPIVLQSNLCQFYVKGRNVIIPVFSETAPTITTDVFVPNFWQLVDEYWQVQANDWEDSSTDIVVQNTDDSAEKIFYLVIDTDNVADGDLITITVNSGVGPPQTETIVLNQLCETKYEPYRVIFYNKYGALQDLYFNKKSTVTLKSTSEKYNRSTIDQSGTDITYSTTKHNKIRFQVQGDERITLNTPLYDECINQTIKELALAEYVWVEDSVKALPVILNTESIVEKTGVNDKAQIQYQMEFEYAFNKINNIR